MEHSSDPVLPAGVRCSVGDLCRWLGAAGPVCSGDALLFPTRRVRAGGHLVHEGAPFENLYFVGAGTFKCVQTDQDGYELVQAFALRGDSIGLDGYGTGRYLASAVALEDSVVAVLPWRDVAGVERGSTALQDLLLRAASRELQRKNAVLQVMAAVGAEVRVARFLLQMTGRQAALGFSSHRVSLRMSRRDIASHLGIAHETVSRSLSALADWGYIRVSHRDVEILDAPALAQFQRYTRKGHEPAAPWERPQAPARPWKAADPRGRVPRAAPSASNGPA
ncbi:Crp/Fnr family transcriptional regulator [Caldimonas brevitalea]|uniref:Transcriptional regulator, Crp/Fnr family n=1 Tax=Caldimonas brevitalea TaxID=413882 RepID=A0A0G3BQ59_9BURK|nr:Crp/Fnr family transcriptional regulator [Caldimonas brevitalea]AKJ29491.1 transcriptional regulator, Crp/Fnr family [Caldimonas brevitalea]